MLSYQTVYYNQIIIYFTKSNATPIRLLHIIDY